jgi:predicted MPP superfamily phosphohydrolase
MNVRSFLASIIGATAIGFGNQVFTLHDDRWLEVTTIPLTLPRLSREFDGYRLAQISDLHIGTWLNRNLLMQVVERVNLQAVDLVAITGDFVTENPQQYRDDLVNCLGKIIAKDGVVAVLGNHDHWSDPQVVREILSEVCIRDLSNDVYLIRRGDKSLFIAGVDDFMEELDQLNQVLAMIPEEEAAILLAHEPDFADISAATGRFDLQLSGHSHGGQIRLPRLGAPFLPRYAHKYPIGLYEISGMYQYTNRGLGTAHLEIRVNCKAEITIFTLHSGRSS